ncbi:MAG TPA: hypothetical protein VGF48_23795 [Thermoanaerobaculia bacterium]|jgi:hypothetical protein
MKKKVVLALLLFAFPLFAQDESTSSSFQNHGSVIGELGTDTRADSFFNPDNALYMPPLHSRLVRLNDDFSATLPYELGVNGKVALEWSGDADSRVTRGQIRELYLTRSLGDFTVTAGRRILKWTNGYAFAPAGVLDPPRNPADPQDRLGRLGGRDIAQVDWFRGDHTATLVYSFPFETRAGGGERVLAARYNVLWKGVDFSAIAAIPSESPERLAFSASYVIGEALELHGETSFQRGSDVILPRAALLDDPRQLLGNDYFTGSDDDDVRMRVLIGANYTFRGGTNLVVELYHTDEGLSAREWNNFLAQSRYADSLRDDPRHQAPIRDGYTLPELNLLQGLSYLRAQEIRRDYGFVRVARAWRDQTLSTTALALVNLHDGSFLVTPEASYTVRRQTSVYARATLFYGNERSQYGNVPTGQSFTVGVRRHF